LSLPLIILDEAEEELNAAADRYEEQVAGLGADFRVEIDRALKLVASLPRSGNLSPGRRGGKMFAKSSPDASHSVSSTRSSRV
jgi:hypothetical protein